MHNFKLVGCDTDGVSFCKQGFEEFTEQERQDLLDELNAQLPELIKVSDDGYYKKVIVLKAKNYILFDGKKITYKGSAVKATGREPALQQFIKDLLNYMLDGNYDFVGLYHTYVKEIMDLKDIKRWAGKKTISSKVLEAGRTNEQIIKDAIAGTDYREGDKAYFYYKADDTLCLVENFKEKDYNPDRLLEKIYKTATSTFSTVIDPKLFINYKLKRSKEALNQLINS